MTEETISRRSVLARLATVAGVAAVGGQTAIALRSLVPNVSYDSPTMAKVGAPDSFADGLTFVADRRLFVVRDGKAFRAMSAVCTHLGCSVRPEAAEEPDPADPDGRRHVQVWSLACPCHGSRYRADGANVSGPAPRPLASFRVSIAPDDGQLVVDVADEVAPAWMLTLP
jgi:menaquinol-cytochrome c reductase iron-sulfur subunit